jgi:hypothetical protein
MSDGNLECFLLSLSVCRWIGHARSVMMIQPRRLREGGWLGGEKRRVHQQKCNEMSLSFPSDDFSSTSDRRLTRMWKYMVVVAVIFSAYHLLLIVQIFFFFYIFNIIRIIYNKPAAVNVFKHMHRFSFFFFCLSLFLSLCVYVCLFKCAWCSLVFGGVRAWGRSHVIHSNGQRVRERGENKATSHPFRVTCKRKSPRVRWIYAVPFFSSIFF